MRLCLPILFHFLFLLPASAQDWHLKKNADGIQVFTKDVEDSGFDAFKAVMTERASVEDVLKLLKDVEHYDRIFPDMVEARLLRREGDSVQYQYTRTGAPWPVSDRDGVFKMIFRRDVHTGAMVSDAEAVPDYLPQKDGVVRIQYSRSHWRLIPEGDGMLRIEYEVQADPGGNIPEWLANSAAVDVPFKTFENLREVLRT